ncbi:hypothetical protein J6590_015815 [Homalodisca vitripennis]|nr:hypothetical protein J6590_015815 [Homalodisca vitripennis]
MVNVPQCDLVELEIWVGNNKSKWADRIIQGSGKRLVTETIQTSLFDRLNSWVNQFHTDIRAGAVGEEGGRKWNRCDYCKRWALLTPTRPGLLGAGECSGCRGGEWVRGLCHRSPRTSGGQGEEDRLYNRMGDGGISGVRPFTDCKSNLIHLSSPSKSSPVGVKISERKRLSVCRGR